MLHFEKTYCSICQISWYSVRKMETIRSSSQLCFEIVSRSRYQVASLIVHCLQKTIFQYAAFPSTQLPPPLLELLVKRMIHSSLFWRRHYVVRNGILYASLSKMEYLRNFIARWEMLSWSRCQVEPWIVHCLQKTKSSTLHFSDSSTTASSFSGSFC